MSDSRRPYPSDLSDAEWELLAPLLAPPGRCGRPRTWPIRHVTDAIFSVLRSGCAWRGRPLGSIPRQFPPWQTVSSHCRQWRRLGTLRRAHDLLRGKIRARERILVDTTGVLLAAKVHGANLHDRDGGRHLLSAKVGEALPRLALIGTDAGYAGEFGQGVDRERGWRIAVVYRPDRQARRYGLDDGLPRGFPVIPRRWVVEPGSPRGSFAWLGQARRLSKDDERLPAVAEEMIFAAMSRSMLRRLARTTHNMAA